MSERALATFLQNLCTDAPRPIGPIRDPAHFQRVVAQPAPPLQTLLTAHIDALLAELPACAYLRPTTVPATALWVGAALNNLAWSTAHPDKRLLTITLRLLDQIPPAASHESALAYHSLLRHLPRLVFSKEWDPVAHGLLAHSPLTALWFPYVAEDMDWRVALDLLAQRPLRVLVRDRLLGLLPPPEVLARGDISVSVARQNEAVGRMFTALLDHGGTAWLPFVLAFYEADCERQRCGTEEKPTWPLLGMLRRAQQQEENKGLRAIPRVLLNRYAPFTDLLQDETVFTPYPRLHVQFLIELGELLPTRTGGLRFHRIHQERT